jgi:hypothetical protein
VELKRKAEATKFHEAHFKCPVKFGARSECPLPAHG